MMDIYSGNYVYGSTDELYHYGVLGMRWGVHKARYYKRQANKYRTTDIAKSARYEQLLDQTKKHLVSKSTEKLRKYGTSYGKRQESASRSYDRAARKERSLLTSESSLNRTYAKADKNQRRANRLAYKGKKWYDRMVKAYGDLELVMDPETMELGKSFVDHVTSQSQIEYASRRRRR